VDDPKERKVIKLVRRSHGKTIAGRRLRFAEPGAGDEERLAAVFDAGDVSAYVSELIAVCVVEPALTVAEVDALPRTARARARVAVAEVLSVAADYRRLKGDGDARLYRAMQLRNKRFAEQMRAIAAQVNDNVVRMTRDAQRVLNQVGGNEAVARLAQEALRTQRQAEAAMRIIGPGRTDVIAQANRAAERIRPAFDGVERNRWLFAEIASSQQGLGESLARTIEPLVRPSYFGALADIRRQVDELVKPRYVESIAKILASVKEALVPKASALSAALGRGAVEWPALTQIRDSVESMQRALVPDVTRLLGAFGENLRTLIANAGAAYAAWLERHWPEAYASPDHPAPVLFLIAALPMSIGLPIYEAVENAKRDEELLDGLERSLLTSSLLDQIEQAVQGSSELDAVATRRFIVALEALGDGRYIDAAPPLCQGLERAFMDVARRRRIIDHTNCFRIPARSSKARKVEDVLEHLALDYGYQRYLRSWVFGEIGNEARHGALADEAAHRRWVLRAVAALLGWFEYCAGDETLMRQLVSRLELMMGEEADSQASSAKYGAPPAGIRDRVGGG